MYYKDIAEIVDLNTSSFWDIRLADPLILRSQDGMTKDRIKLACDFLPNNAKRILDIGAGKGFLEEMLCKRKGIKIYGNDISEVSIRSLKMRFKGDFIKGSIYNIKYPPRSFDVIYVLEVLEHIPPSKIFAVLGRIKSFLKKSGTLIASVPSNEVLEQMDDNPNAHVRDYTKELIKAELKLAGFKVVRIETLYAFKQYYFLKKLIARIIPNRWQPNNIVLKSVLI